MDEEARKALIEAKTRIMLLQGALLPFVQYVRWAREHEWSKEVSKNPDSVVHGVDIHEAWKAGKVGVAVYVRDYEAAEKILGWAPDETS